MMIVATIPQGSYVKIAASAVMPWKSIDAIATVTTRLTEPQEVIALTAPAQSAGTALHPAASAQKQERRLSNGCVSSMQMLLLRKSLHQEVPYRARVFHLL